MAVKITPGNRNESSHDFALIAANHKVGFNFADEDARSMVQQLISPTLVINESAGKYGDYDPLFTNFILDDWFSGMGLSEYDISRSGFNHSRYMWTGQGDRIYPSPLAKYGDGIITVHENQNDDMAWWGLWGDYQYIGHSFTTAAGDTYDAANCEVYIRKIGAPGTLTVKIYDDNSNPNSAVTDAVDTITINDVDDILFLNNLFDLSAASELTAATTYWFVIYGADEDDRENTWEIKVNTSGTDGVKSGDGSSWSSANLDPIYRITETTVERRWIIFLWKWLEYFVDVKADGTASQIFANGLRGKATAATATTLQNTNITLVVDAEIGNYIYPYSGTGAGQSPRLITDNDTDTVTVDGWEETPDNTTLYVIFGSGVLREITGHGLGPVKDLTVSSNFVYFAQGSGDNIRRMQWDDTESPPVYEYDDEGTNKADFIQVHAEFVDGPIIWRGENSGPKISYAEAATTWADVTWKDDINVGDSTYLMTDLVVYNNLLHVMKENHPFRIYNKKPEPIIRKSAFIPHPDNGRGAIEHDVFFMVPWGGNFLLQNYQTSNDDISIAQRGDGLPADEVGGHTSMISHPGGVFYIIDGGRDNYSSIFIYDDARRSHHPVFRSFRTGQRIQTVYWQNNFQSKPRLWFSIGGDLMYMDMPVGFRPLKDTSMVYHFESVIETGTITLNSRSMQKFFDAAVINSDNLNSGTRIRVQYKIDEQIDNTNFEWRDIGDAERSPEVSLDIGVGNTRSIRFRVIFETSDASNPPVLDALTLKGIGRKPARQAVTFRVTSSSAEVDFLGEDDIDPYDMKMFLYMVAEQMQPVYIESPYQDLNGARLIVDLGTMIRLYSDDDRQFGSDFTFIGQIYKEGDYAP